MSLAGADRTTVSRGILCGKIEGGAPLPLGKDIKGAGTPAITVSVRGQLVQDDDGLGEITQGFRFHRTHAGWDPKFIARHGDQGFPRDLIGLAERVGRQGWRLSE